MKYCNLYRGLQILYKGGDIRNGVCIKTLWKHVVIQAIAIKENVIEVYDKGAEFKELCSGDKRAKTAGFWLPGVRRVHFKVLLCVYRALHGQAPDYLAYPQLCHPARALRSGADSLRAM